MKFTKYFMPLAAIALLASCSNDNVNQPEVNDGLDLGEKAYINLSISIPSITGTRAVTFADGMAKEYDLADGKVYLFTNDTEEKCVAIGTLPVNYNMDSNNDITSTINFYRVEVSGNDENPFKNSSSAGYKALVILNTKGFATTSLPDINTKYTTWAEKELDVATNPMVYDLNSKQYFTMTNALGWPKGSIDADPTDNILPTVTKDNVYLNSADAEGIQPVTVYVQRVVAKVSMGSASKVKIGEAHTIDGGSNDKVTLAYWALDITNKKTYPVQLIKHSTNGTAFPTTYSPVWNNMNSDGSHDRFLGVGDKFARIYWALDPNYSAGAFADFNSMYTSADTWGDLSTGGAGFSTGNEAETGDHTAAYCLENTFDLDNMNKQVTTRVVFRANYQVDGEEAGANFVTFGNKKWVPDVTLKQTLSGTYALKDLVQTENMAEAIEALGATENDQVNYYVGGICYYSVRIRHFENDELAAVKETDEFYKEPWQFNGTYGDDYKHYLGRYGVVRNNWYIVNINTISGPGTPTPDPGDGPDDDPDPYKIDVNINILAWAQRSHGYDL